MRSVLPILLLTAAAALAQAQPASDEKPVQDDRGQLCPLNGPTPAWVQAAGNAQALPPKGSG